MKPILALACFVLAAFCVFGFLASFEPLGRSAQLMWRIVYGVGVFASLAGVVCIATSRRREDG